MRRLTTVFTVATLLLLAGLAAFPQPAVAARTTPFSFTYVTTDEPDTSCGFLVERDVGKAMGRASDTRFDITNAGVATLTNPATGLFVTQKYQVLFKNRNFVTDPETGFQSTDNTAVGPSTLYDMNGNVLLRSHGPITTHLVMDPSLPFPDSIISQEITFEHGAHDGYCETLTAVLGA